MSAPLSPNERFRRLFLLKNIDERLAKNGKPYLSLVFGTPEGDFEGRFWDMDAKSLPGLVEGDPVTVTGVAQLYQDRIQLVADGMEKVESFVDPREIYPSSPLSEHELMGDFQAFTEEIKGDELRAVIGQMRKDEKVFNAFFRAPAARAMHHACIGGLAQHSLDVCRKALALGEVSPGLDRDLLTAGALLHDIGKIREYEVAGDFRYSLDGKFIGHIVRGAAIVEGWMKEIPGFPERLGLELLHIILSHHGQLELGSPKLPATAEAMVIHYCDDLDAKLEMIHSTALQTKGPEAFVKGLRRTFQFRGEGESERDVQRPTSNDQRQAGGEDVQRPAASNVRRQGKGVPREDDDQGELF